MLFFCPRSASEAERGLYVYASGGASALPFTAAFLLFQKHGKEEKPCFTKTTITP
jgi:hypothetical protein